jgi:hypothetical protein
MRRLVPLIVTLLSLECGNEPASPSPLNGDRVDSVDRRKPR